MRHAFHIHHMGHYWHHWHHHHHFHRGGCCLLPGCGMFLLLPLAFFVLVLVTRL